MNRKKLNQEERKKIYSKCNGHCAYCGCDLEYKDMQADHVIPLYRGGADTIDNMLPTCRSCNYYKSTRTAEEFRTYLSGIPQRLHRDSIPYQVAERFGMIKADPSVKFWYEKKESETEA